MKEIHVTPHEGIAMLKLGMSPDEILNTIYQMRAEWNLPNPGRLQMTNPREESRGTSVIRYQDDTFFFMVTYKDNQAIEVAIDNELREQTPIMLYDMDVFRIPAEDVLAKLKARSSYSCDLNDEELATNYDFHDIGVRLWREHAFHPKLLKDEEYMRALGHMLDEEVQYQYFQLVAVNAEGYI